MPCQAMSMAVVHVASGTRNILVFLGRMAEDMGHALQYLTGMHLMGVHLTWVYLMDVRLTGVHLMGRVPHRRCTSQACTSWAYTFQIQKGFGENLPPYKR